MRPIFCGNLEFDARQSDVERLFKRYGKVDRVDMKSGFAFVYMEDERDAEDAIRKLDRIDFGRKGRRLRVEWTKQERGGRRPDTSRRNPVSSKPSKTLFVINFDPINTRTRDLEKHFEQYGRIANVRIRRNFSFVQFELLEDATRALEATHMSKLMDRVISVEYAMRDDDDRRNAYSPDRRGGRDASPNGRGYGRGRSPSPYRRDRGSPDYAHGSVPNPRNDRRDSPDYERDEPVPNSRSGRRGSADYTRAESPVNDRYHRLMAMRGMSVKNFDPARYSGRSFEVVSLKSGFAGQGQEDCHCTQSMYIFDPATPAIQVDTFCIHGGPSGYITGIRENVQCLPQEDTQKSETALEMHEMIKRI